MKLITSICIAALAATTAWAQMPRPSKDQIRLQDMEMYAFLHYSLNTYTDQEWGYGNEDPALFNPNDLDVKQWVRVCRQSGMKGIILTAKHHCGFCLWPSKYTDYSVKSSPWKDGKGDVVRELSDACRKEGLKFAIYLSPWDRNHPGYGRPEYVTYFRNQLRELLTEYGDIFELWFDGANGGDGWYGGADEQRQIDHLTYYQWGETYSMIRRLQPHCIIWNDNGDRRGDLRWVGTEAGYIGETNWSTMPSGHETQWADLHYGVEDGDVWCPGETNTSIRPGWFYHAWEDGQVKSPSKLMETYYKSVGRNSTLLLNFPIMPNGLIHPTDSLNGLAFKKAIDALYESEVKAKVRKDGNAWTLTFKQPAAINRFMACEDIRQGQRVKKFHLEALVEGRWQPLKDEWVDKGDGLTTIGRKRIICFPMVKAEKLRFTIDDAKAEPIIKRLAVFCAPDTATQAAAEGAKHSSKLNISYVDGGDNPSRSILIDLGSDKLVKGFRYLPPGQPGAQGIITSYALFAMIDGQWRQLSRGEFSNIVNNPIWQVVNIDPVQTRLLRIDAVQLNSEGSVSFEDIEILTE